MHLREWPTVGGRVNWWPPLRTGDEELAAVERAFSLARSGQCRSVAEVIRRLPEEDGPAIEAHLSAPTARRELILICSDAWLAAR